MIDNRRGRVGWVWGVLMFGLWMVSAGAVGAAPTPSCESIENVFEQLRCQEPAKLAAHRKWVRRDGTVLSIATEQTRIKRETVCVQNEDACDADSVEYIYLGFNDRLRAHEILAVAHLGEDTAVELVHQQSGQVAYPVGRPMLAPGGAYFLATADAACLSCGLDAEIEIWRVLKTGFYNIASFKPGHWLTQEKGGRWLNADTAVIDKLCFNDKMDERAPTFPYEPCGEAVIRRVGTAWKMKE